MFRAPEARLLPTLWMTDALFPLLQGKAMPWLPVLAVWSTALALLALLGWVGAALYPAGVARAQEGRVRLFMDRPGRAPRGRLLGGWLDRLAGASRRLAGPLLVKDLRAFFRDPNQWLQLLLLGALAAVYLLNFVYLKVANFSWFTLFTVNHVLIGLVLSGVAVRFVFPAVSLEGRAWWIIRSAPIRLGDFLHAKLLINFVPLAGMGLFLSVLSCLVIDVPGIFVVLSAGMVLVLSLVVSALGVGLGAVYPRFTVENIAKIPTGIGGVAFMITSSCYVIGSLLASFYPTFVLFELPRRLNHPVARLDWLVASLLATLVLAVAGSWVPMAIGRRQLARRED
jgi:ABC-2 type transport system permease protein